MSNDPHNPRSLAFVTHLTGSQSRLYTYILSLTADPDLAGDVLQETNIVIWKKATEFEPGSNFSAWAMRIAHFQVLAARQRLARDRLTFNDDMLDNLAADAAAVTGNLDERLRALHHCMATLTPRHRELIERRYTAAESVQDIADDSDLKPNAVAQALHRARLALMRCIESRLEESGDA